MGIDHHFAIHCLGRYLQRNASARALLAGAESIREVIAFPKTASGGDPLTGAPTPITDAQRKESGVDFKPEAQQ